MSVLLCRHSTFAADLAHVERLETNLRQRNSEISRLNDKIRKLDKEIQESKVSPCSFILISSFENLYGQLLTTCTV